METTESSSSRLILKTRNFLNLYLDIASFLVRFWWYQELFYFLFNYDLVVTFFNLLQLLTTNLISSFSAPNDCSDKRRLQYKSLQAYWTGHFCSKTSQTIQPCHIQTRLSDWRLWTSRWVWCVVCITSFKIFPSISVLNQKPDDGGRQISLSVEMYITDVLNILTETGGFSIVAQSSSSSGEIYWSLQKW